MLGLLILLACLIAGHGLHSASPLPIPAAIFGMLILFVALLLFGKVPLPLQHTVTQLSPLLPLFLIPVSAGIVTQAQVISEHGLQLAIILFISLIPGILVCGWLMKKAMAMTKLLQLPLFWTTATVAVFLIGQYIYRLSGHSPLLPPILSAVALLVTLLLLTDTSYAVYMQGGELLHIMLGPVIVMLAVPFYQYVHTMRRQWPRILLAISAGSATTIGVAVLLADWWIGIDSISRTIATKSITTPVAVAISEQSGGLAALASAFVIVTGIFGALMAPAILRWIKRDDAATMGLTLGVCAHAIGTSRAMELGQQQAAYAALAMTLTATLHAIFLPLLLPWLI